MRSGLTAARNVASFTGRLKTVKRFIVDAGNEGVAIVCFPEAYLPGLRGFDFDGPEPDQRRQGAARERLEDRPAWALKETAMRLFDYRHESAARAFFEQWRGWASRSRLAPVVAAERMLTARFENNLTYLEHRITNEVSEGLNSRHGSGPPFAASAINRTLSTPSNSTAAGSISLPATNNPEKPNRLALQVRELPCGMPPDFASAVIPMEHSAGSERSKGPYLVK